MNKDKLSESMISILDYLNRKPSQIKCFCPRSTSYATDYYEDWGEGRTPQALHSLVRKGYMINGNLQIPARYNYFELTQKALDWIAENKETIDSIKSKQKKIQEEKDNKQLAINEQYEKEYAERMKHN